MFNCRTLSIVNIYSGNHKTGERRRRRLIAIIIKYRYREMGKYGAVTVFHVHWTM